MFYSVIGIYTNNTKNTIERKIYEGYRKIHFPRCNMSMKMT